ncbi:unnamed protein product [Ectocarpus sp. CCAP 1310/34]|nr:unnamed protein product [Ectocarpus sp. CCAP 1310/34]
MLAHCAQLLALSSLLSLPSLIEAFLGPAPRARSLSTGRDRTPVASCVVMSDQQQQSNCRSSRLLTDAPATLISEAGREARGRPDQGLEDIVPLVAALEAACKGISMLVRRAAIAGATGVASGGGQNAGGDEQKKLDVVSNDLLKGFLARSGVVRVLASEEEDEPVVVEGNDDARYVVVFDPLDGSSNIDASIPTGTIFGVFLADSSKSARENALQPGNKLVAGGYCLYSSSTVMVISLGAGTHVFQLDRDLGEFVLTKHSIKMPARGRSYSLNEAREPDWPDGLKQYISDMKTGAGQSGERYNLVYVCSLVADVHYTLFEGGVAMNPRSHLRLVYEGNPMGWVVEQAGGRASTGVAAMLDKEPSDIHERIPTFLGSEDDIMELERYGDVQQLGNKKYAA